MAAIALHVFRTPSVSFFSAQCSGGGGGGFFGLFWPLGDVNYLVCGQKRPVRGSRF